MASPGKEPAQVRPGLVITALGPDRPGLIFDLSTQITHRGGNIEDTKMSKLGGMFAVMMLVTGSEVVLNELMGLEGQWETQFGIRCSLVNTHAAPSTNDEDVWRFSASGLDRPGIVAQVSDLLAKRGVNVTSFSSRIEYAPLSGTPMFVFEAECSFPANVKVSEVEEALRVACEKEGLEISSSSTS